MFSKLLYLQSPFCKKFLLISATIRLQKVNGNYILDFSFSYNDCGLSTYIFSCYFIWGFPYDIIRFALLIPGQHFSTVAFLQTGIYIYITGTSLSN